MSGSNALLQGTDPNASGNALAQAPSWSDPDPTMDPSGTGADPLGQWLSQQRAKRPQMGLWDNAPGALPQGSQQPGGQMGQYMNWLLAPQGQQQQPGPAPMMPVGIPLPQYAPTPPGMAPTGPVATGSTADPYGLNAWALQQGIAAQNQQRGGGTQ
jgi:hypothetical protein